MIYMVVENGKSCPVVLCDHCGERITGSGNYQWLISAEQSRPAEVFFTHKRCCHAFEIANPAPEGTCWGAMEIQAFPIYLGNNLKIDWKRAKGRARIFATILS